jgi:hypothetical protein
VNDLVHVLKIADKYDAFTCPVNRLHLYFYNPAGEAKIISEEIKQALKVKKIIDVNGTINLEDAAEEPKEEVRTIVAESVTIGEKQEEPVEETIEEAVEEEQEGINLEELNKEELLSFVKENDLTMKELGITGKSSEKKIREAILNHLQKEAK